MNKRLRLFTLLATMACTIIGCVCGAIMAVIVAAVIIVGAGATLALEARWTRWRNDVLAHGLAPYLQHSLADEARQWLDERS